MFFVFFQCAEHDSYSCLNTQNMKPGHKQNITYYNYMISLTVWLYGRMQWWYSLLSGMHLCHYVQPEKRRIWINKETYSYTQRLIRQNAAIIINFAERTYTVGSSLNNFHFRLWYFSKSVETPGHNSVLNSLNTKANGICKLHSFLLLFTKLFFL